MRVPCRANKAGPANPARKECKFTRFLPYLQGELGGFSVDFDLGTGCAQCDAPAFNPVILGLGNQTSDQPYAI
jgi:hypothetical protein